MRALPILFSAFAAPLLLPAQDAAQAETAAITAKDLIVKGGDLMYVLVFLSLVAVMLVLYYCLTLRRGVLAPAKFIRAAQDAAEAGDWEQLQELAAKDGSLAAKAVLAAVQERENGLEGARQAMEEEGARQTSLLWGRLQYLMDVASIAPMVGLLGTVWGMMVSFLALDTQLAMANKVSNLTSGVSQAMFTTFGGLVIAIFSLAAYALFRGRLNRLAAQVEGECKSVLRRFRKA
ncbi:MAG: MotA/TolQ/ExbB proton channel family protein [Oligosphaeraceae bacterium]